MRINVKANFRIAGIDNDHAEIEGRPTLGSLLIDLAKGSDFPFLLSDGKIEPEVEIRLNGLEYPFLPKGLDTRVKEGDLVEVMILALGGG